MQNILISVPKQSDLDFVLDFVRRMNFQSKVLTDKELSILELKINQYIDNSPKDVPLTASDIVDEIKKVRVKSKNVTI